MAQNPPNTLTTVTCGFGRLPVPFRDQIIIMATVAVIVHRNLATACRRWSVSCSLFLSPMMYSSVEAGLRNANTTYAKERKTWWGSM